MTDAMDFARATTSGALWVAVSYGLGMVAGSNPSLMDCAVDGGLMSASAIASDWLHAMVQMEKTGVTSAVATGGSFALAQKLVRGSNDYLMNAGLAGGNDLAVEAMFGGKSGSRMSSSDE